MAQRSLINANFLRRISTQIIAGNRAKVSSRPPNVDQGRLLYDPKTLKANYGIIPLLVIVLGGCVVLSGFVVRNVMTRDDIRFHSKGKFGYEQEKNFDGQRKFVAFNQKFQSPEGLKELYEEMKKEE